MAPCGCVCVCVCLPAGWPPPAPSFCMSSPAVCAPSCLPVCCASSIYTPGCSAALPGHTVPASSIRHPGTRRHHGHGTRRPGMGGTRPGAPAGRCRSRPPPAAVTPHPAAMRLSPCPACPPTPSNAPWLWPQCATQLACHQGCVQCLGQSLNYCSMLHHAQLILLTHRHVLHVSFVVLNFAHHSLTAAGGAWK